ncbi:hypothetical protein [Parasitella parasitica]|uniref:Glycosyl transferase 64 domain-containing protein n=1 Tax=Parasitella parasitica TaxID=35722 RepID=A0A0B7NGB7_9FUNG|nr:hypothetical protein [Parasitella parasitica]
MSLNHTTSLTEQSARTFSEIEQECSAQSFVSSADRTTAVEDDIQLKPYPPSYTTDVMEKSNSDDNASILSKKRRRWLVFRRVAYIVIMNAAIPIALYYVLKEHLPAVWALVLSSTPTIISVIVQAIFMKRIDSIGVAVIFGFILSVVLAVLNGDPKMLLLRESFVTAGVGAVCAITLIPIRYKSFVLKPVLYYLASDLIPLKPVQFQDATKPPQKRMDFYWQYSAFCRFHFRLLTAIDVVILELEFGLKLFYILRFDIDTVVVLSNSTLSVIGIISWRLLVGFLSAILLVYLFQSSTFDTNTSKTTTANSKLADWDVAGDSRTKADSIPERQQRPGEKAFVTFLCDDVMGEATEVLVYSLKQTHTQHDIVVLVLDDVTQTVRSRLEYLGAKIINVDQIKYPWNSSSARRKGFNKACRYSKLNLWNLTQYKKVVFLDADTMVVNNIDELFEYPQFTAAVDIGGVLNTGVFVAEPNAETYKDIMETYENAPSYNKGDQGFLNYYFNKTANPLPGNYNLMIKFTHFSTLASGFVTKNTVKVLHYTSETKPWNFHFLHQREWRENYDGYLFGLWTRSRRQMRAQLAQGGLWTSAEDWDNKGRVADICDRRLKSNYGRKYPKKNQFTVILTLNKDSINKQYLEQMLRVYASSKKVYQIFINGNSIKDQHGKRFSLNQAYLRSLKLRKPVKANARGSYSTVNWKFNPIQGITTDAVFLADENIITSLEDLEFAFDVWRKNMDSIVGFTSDAHSLQAATTSYSFVENLDADSRYSMINNNMFLKSDFLYGYTCIMPEEIHQYIDKYPACRDIAINMLVSGQTGSSPMLVKADYLFKFDDRHPQTTLQRSQCINELSVLFNGKNPLILNNEIISKASPKQVNSPTSWDSGTSSVPAIKAGRA